MRLNSSQQAGKTMVDQHSKTSIYSHHPVGQGWDALKRDTPDEGGQIVASPDLVMVYVDAGSAGYVLQLVLGVAAGSVMTLVIFWRRFTSRVKGLFTRNSNRPGDEQ